MTSRASSSSRVQEWGRRHPKARMALFVALFGFVLSLDVARLEHVLHRLPQGAADPVLDVGAVTGTALVAYVAWLVRARWRGTPRGSRWWSPVLAGLGPFLLAHPRHASTQSATLDVTGLGRFCLAFSVVVLAAGVPALALVVVRMAQGRMPAANGETAGAVTRCPGPAAVWHVSDAGSAAPHFIARCACGWVGMARDEARGRGQDKAFVDARVHTTDVQPDVVQPVD